MNQDFINHDAIVYLTANRRKGTYSTEVRLKNGRRVRTAGRLNASATAHSLLSIGLVAALRSISGNTLKRLGSGRKARLKVISTDPTWIDALRALTANDRAAIAEKPFRAGKQFLNQLARQLARFTVALEADSEDQSYAFQSLRNFVQEHVHNPRKQLWPAFLVPVAVSESH